MSTMGNKIGYDLLLVKRKRLTLLRFSPRCYNNNKEANQWQEPISIGSCCQWISDNACKFAYFIRLRRKSIALSMFLTKTLWLLS